LINIFVRIPVDFATDVCVESIVAGADFPLAILFARVFNNFLE
jgi:hypothetical protein